MVYQREKLGVDEMRYADGYHDNYYITTMIMVGDPADVRLEERIDADRASINGFSLLPVERSLWHGRQLIEFRCGFRAKWARHSEACGPPIPRDVGQGFRGMWARDSEEEVLSFRHVGHPWGMSEGGAG